MGLFKKLSGHKNVTKQDSRPESAAIRAENRTPLPPVRTGENLFRHVPLGSGGTFFLDQSEPGSIEAIHYLGTTVCLNSVGVFLEISDTKCFCAHIDAFVDNKATASEQTSGNGDGAVNSAAASFRKQYATDFMTARSLRNEVFSRLDRAAQAGGWGAKSGRMRMSLVMTCAKMYGQEPQAAEVVAEAVREWLGAGATEKDKEKRVATSGAAMVVGWPDAGAKVFDDAPGPEWSAVDAGVGDGVWSFGVEDKGLEGSEESW